ncbi:MAG: FAD-dependent oxidoreductase [Candidatus Zambryskibacteria bacterium]|nr:FAD-dependent oxidoreductase [Candidatus Zambryskibacteria bacterium]
MNLLYDLAIIGGGPAGVSAGVYAARKRLKTIFITETFGGQSTESVGIENWIGTINIPGAEFGKMLENHLRAYAGDFVEIKLNKVNKVDKFNKEFQVKCEDGEIFTAKTVLIATGSTRRKLEIPGAQEFENKGITYCASCDGPLFSGQDVVVIGGGNAGFESAAQLLAYAKSVTLLNRSDVLKADEVTVERVSKHPNMRVIKNAVPKEVKGDKFVNALVYEENGETKELLVTGIFVEIGLVPTTSFVKGLAELNQYGQIIVDPKTQMTSVEGLWAAGDSTDGLYHQNNVAAGDAVKALEDIYLHIHTK